jgi:hypothetical protein
MENDAYLLFVNVQFENMIKKFHLIDDHLEKLEKRIEELEVRPQIIATPQASPVPFPCGPFLAEHKGPIC